MHKRLESVRAGQDPAIFYDPATRAFDTHGGDGIPPERIESWQDEENPKPGLRAGRIIVLAIDGVCKSESVGGEMYSKAQRENI
jgi:hypothetical protein